MPSTSETGHAKNVANFEDLISFCNGYGATYNPSKDALTSAKLTDLQTNAKASLQQAKLTKTRDLYSRAMIIGKDHITSMVNTLVLAYAGAQSPNPRSSGSGFGQRIRPPLRQACTRVEPTVALFSG